MAEAIAAGLGDNCIDRYLPLRRSTVGGNALNVAVQLARLGIASAYFGAVGEDAEGARVVAALRDHGVAGAVRTVAGAPTAFTEIGVAAGGERIIGREEFGASGLYAPEAAEMAALARLRHVHLGWLADAATPKARLIAAGVAVSQDVSVNLPAGQGEPAGLAVAFASAGPALEEGRRRVAELLARGAAAAVVTCGAAGSLACEGGAVKHVAARPVAVVDTLGAGDSYIAGFLAARLGGAGLGAAMEAGRDAAAATCRHLGGFPQAPAELP